MTSLEGHYFAYYIRQTSKYFITHREQQCYILRIIDSELDPLGSFTYWLSLWTLLYLSKLQFLHL